MVRGIGVDMVDIAEMRCLACGMTEGALYVVIDDALGEALAAAGASAVHISITTEANFATAFAVVE